VFRRLFRFTSRTDREVADDVHDEIEFHLDHRVGELVDQGWPPEQANAEARRQFGDIAGTAAYCRTVDGRKESRMRLRLIVEELAQDAAYGIRTLVRQPELTAIAMLTIALGIGATALVFAVVHRVLLAPLPYPDADRLVVTRLSLPDYADLQRTVTAFEPSGVWASNLYMLDEKQVLGGVVSPSVFTTLGVAPIVGRAIAESDGASPVLVLSYGLWQRRFGADPRVIGRTVRLTGTAFTIIGVMPRAFRFPTSAFELWTAMPFAMTQAPGQSENRSLRIFQTVARLRPGGRIEQAQAELSALAATLQRVHPDTNAGVSFPLISLRERQVGSVRPALLVALASAGCLLLIACANVANLMVARMSARTQELAVRAALGAGRSRLARQLVTESLLLATFGGALGVLLAQWGVGLLPSLVGNRVPRIDEIGLNAPVLLAAILGTVATGVLVGLAPVFQLRTAALEPALRGGGRGETDSAHGGRLRSALVVAQVAIAVIVLAGGLLLTHSLLRLLQVDTGVKPDRLLAFNVQLIQQPTAEARAATAEALLERIRTVPGIVAAGGATGLSPITAQRGTTFDVEGQPDAPIDARGAYFIAASPQYFRTLGARVVAGREFSAADSALAPHVVVVSETLARRFFPDSTAVGRRLRLVNPEYPNDWRTIVGVIRDIRYQGLNDGPRPVVYTPFAQTPFFWMYVHARTAGEPMAALPSIRAAVKSTDSRLSLGNPMPMTALVAEASADPRFSAISISTFAAAAVLLASIGLYGVVSFGVVRRRREIAIQLALGAPAHIVRTQVIRRAVLLSAGGLLIGLLVTIWVGRLMEGLLFEVTPTDPLTIGMVAAILLTVTLAAAAIPAARATAIDPVQTLRDA